MSSPFRSARALARALTLTLALALALAGCDPSPRDANEAVVSGEDALVMTSEFRAGGRPPDVTTINPVANDPAAMAEGERLYGWMNCAGCHGPSGGGGIGPPLRDGDWIYGGDPASIFQSIGQGRPNGMPAFGGRIPDEQIWQIAHYVRSLSAGTPEQGSGGSGHSSPAGATQKRGQSQPAQAGGSR